MTESELLNLYLEVHGVIANSIAWAGSATIVLYTVAYMVGTKLKIHSVTSIVLVFLGILTYQYFWVITYTVYEGDIVASLRELQSNGAQLTLFSENLLSRVIEGKGLQLRPFAMVVIPLIIAFPLGGIWYLFFQYQIGRKSTGNETSRINT